MIHDPFVPPPRSKNLKLAQDKFGNTKKSRKPNSSWESRTESNTRGRSWPSSKSLSPWIGFLCCSSDDLLPPRYFQVLRKNVSVVRKGLTIVKKSFALNWISVLFFWWSFASQIFSSAQKKRIRRPQRVNHLERGFRLELDLCAVFMMASLPQIFSKCSETKGSCWPSSESPTPWTRFVCCSYDDQAV